MQTNSNILPKALRGATAIVLLLAATIGAFGALGDGKSTDTKPAKKSLLSAKPEVRPGYFTLRSGYKFRGSQVINTTNSTYINLNTTATYQQGNTTYIVPIQKKAILNDKIVFNPNAATRRN